MNHRMIVKLREGLNSTGNYPVGKPHAEHDLPMPGYFMISSVARDFSEIVALKQGGERQSRS
jgi:hypothetical protein